MPENRKDLVDDQKRRARRRLVGAAILALAAAVIIPLFLESEPKPLGQDVQILIPAVEGGKFVNQLSVPGQGDGRVAAPAVLPDAAAKAELAGPAGEGKADPKAPVQVAATASTPAVATAPEPARAATPEPTAKPAPAPVPAKPAVTPAAPSAPGAPKTGAGAAPASPAPVSPKSADSGFVVQLGAYADAKVAAQLQAKLKTAGFMAYTERFETSREKLHRVRVGPYPTREAADAARVQLKAKGHSGIVAPLP